MTEQERTDDFVRLVGGVRKADRLQWIWNTSYPYGTEYDRVFKTGFYKTKEDVFRSRARKEGFSEGQINAFLSL